jgi:hypothetical protein
VKQVDSNIILGIVQDSSAAVIDKL